MIIACFLSAYPLRRDSVALQLCVPSTASGPQREPPRGSWRNSRASRGPYSFTLMDPLGSSAESPQGSSLPGTKTGWNILPLQYEHTDNQSEGKPIRDHRSTSS